MDHYLERHLIWQDREYDQWGDESEPERMRRVMNTIDRLTRQLPDLSPEDRQRQQQAIEALSASIEDLGF